ncbi:MAG: hypothetical protein HYT87_00120 [Nitrospirae bacterium]|nr:hypothetical protein [Nitrospirota bacterium]
MKLNLSIARHPRRGAGLLLAFFFLASPSCSDSDKESGAAPPPPPTPSACADPALPTTVPGLAESAATPSAISLQPASAGPGQPVYVTIEGSLPTPCYKLSRMEEKRDGCSIFLNPVMIDKGEICIQVIGSFKETYTLTAPDLPGRYWIIAGKSSAISSLLEVTL